MTETTTYTLIDGRKVSTDIKAEIVQKVIERKAAGKKVPHLAIILVGDDGASQTYVDFKVKACKEVGFHYTMMRFADTISEDKLMKHIDQVNRDEDVDGFIVQLPFAFKKIKVVLARSGRWVDDQFSGGGKMNWWYSNGVGHALKVGIYWRIHRDER